MDDRHPTKARVFITPVMTFLLGWRDDRKGVAIRPDRIFECDIPHDLGDRMIALGAHKRALVVVKLVWSNPR
jgi:hypothetical protein